MLDSLSAVFVICRLEHFLLDSFTLVLAFLSKAQNKSCVDETLRPYAGRLESLKTSLSNAYKYVKIQKIRRRKQTELLSFPYLLMIHILKKITELFRLRDSAAV